MLGGAYPGEVARTETDKGADVPSVESISHDGAVCPASAGGCGISSTMDGPSCFSTRILQVAPWILLR